LKWDHRKGLQLERIAAFLIAGIAAAAFFGAVAAAGEELGADALQFVDAMPPLSQEALSVQRGGAVLPGGMSVEISGLERLMVDGEDLAASSLLSSVPLGAESGNWAELAGSSPDFSSLPLTVTNDENSISIGQFREINIEIRNVPIPLQATPVFPSEVYNSTLLP